MKRQELPEGSFIVLLKNDGPDDPPLPEGWCRVAMALVIPHDEEDDDGALDEESGPRSVD